MLNQAWGVVIYLLIRWVFNPISRGISGLNRVIRSKLWALCFITADFNKGGPSVKTAWFVWALRFFTINFLLFDFFAFLPGRLFQPLLLLVIFIVLVKSPIYQIKTKVRHKCELFGRGGWAKSTNRVLGIWRMSTKMRPSLIAFVEYKPQNS